MMMRMKINIDECDDVWCGVSVWVVGCAGSRQCCIQHRAAADGRHTPAVGLHTHTHVLIRIQSSTPICKHADSLMKYSVVTHTTCQYVYDDYCLGKKWQSLQERSAHCSPPQALYQDIRCILPSAMICV